MSSEMTFLEALPARIAGDFVLVVRAMDGSRPKEELPMPTESECSDLGGWLAGKSFAVGAYSVSMQHSGPWPKGERKVQLELAPLTTVIKVGGDSVPMFGDSTEDDFKAARGVAGETATIKQETAKLRALMDLEEVRARMEGPDSSGSDPAMLYILRRMEERIGQPKNELDMGVVLKIMLSQQQAQQGFMMECFKLLAAGSGGGGGMSGMKDFFSLFEKFKALDLSGEGGGDGSIMGAIPGILQSVAAIRAPAQDTTQENAGTPLQNGPLRKALPEIPAAELAKPPTIEERGLLVQRQRCAAFVEHLEIEFQAGAEADAVASYLDKEIGLLPPPVRKSFDLGTFEVSTLREFLTDAQFKSAIDRFSTPAGMAWMREFLAAFKEEEEVEDAEDAARMLAVQDPDDTDRNLEAQDLAVEWREHGIAEHDARNPDDDDRAG